MNTTTMRRALRTGSGLAIALAVPGAALAQDADTGGLEEIVVTAQKREQSLQDVPVAVTAVSQDTLQVNRVVNVMDLNGLAPGLAARQNAGSTGSPSYTLRGAFASASVPAQDRQVSSYLDGVYIGGTRGAVFDLPDLARIEVLRGPQGTLFGRNATAGAVSIVTREPTGEFGLRQDVTFGNYDQLRTRTTVELPRIGILSGFVTYVHDERRGDVRNLGAGTSFDRTKSITGIGVLTSPKWLGSKNSESIFASLRLEPSDDLSISYKFDWSDIANTPEARVPTVLNPADFVGGTLLAVLAAQPAGGGAFGPVVFYPENKRPKAVNNAWTAPGYVKTSGHNLTVELQASDSLSFKNVAAYRESESLGISSIFGVSGLQFTAGAIPAYAFFATVSRLGAGYFALPAAQQQAIIGGTIQALTPATGLYFAGYEGQNYGKYWQFSNELQANYQSEKLTVTAGAIYFKSHELTGGVPFMSANVAFQPVPPTLPLGNVQDTIQNTVSIAAYAQAELHLTDRLDIVAGGRVTRDNKKNTFRSGGTFANGAITGISSFRSTFKKTKPTFSLGANYKVTDDTLVYGKYATAYLSGGSAGPLSFAPETVTSWEAGLKTDLLDRRLRFNLALWQATYKHSQAAQSGQNVFVNGQSLSQFGVVVVDNGTVKAKGFEAEVNAAPVDGLTLGGQLSYTDLAWKSPSPLVTTGRPVKPASVPKWMAGANAQYVTPALFGDATMLLRLDAIYTGKYRATPFTDLATVAPVFLPYVFNAGRWILNGRIALRDVKMGPATAEIAVWARNLTDNRDSVYPLLFGSIGHNASYQPARTIGVDLSFKM